MPNEIVLDDSVLLVKELETVGRDMIHVSAGVAGEDAFMDTPCAQQPYGVFTDFAKVIKAVVKIPLSVSGEYRPH